MFLTVEGSNLIRFYHMYGYVLEHIKKYVFKMWRDNQST